MLARSVVPEAPAASSTSATPAERRPGRSTLTRCQPARTVKVAGVAPPGVSPTLAPSTYTAPGTSLAIDSSRDWAGALARYK